MTTETDRELLELAAKAAGLRVTWEPVHSCYWVDLGQGLVHEPWEPLKNDGQALRLGAALRLHILHNDPDDSVLWVSAVLNKRGIHGVAEFQDEVQRAYATRRAIVRAAAAITRATHKEQT